MKFAEELFTVLEDDPHEGQKELISFLYHIQEMFKLNTPNPEITLLGFTFSVDLKMRTLSFSEMEDLGYEQESFDKLVKILNSLNKKMQFYSDVDNEETSEIIKVFSYTSVNMEKEEISFKFSDEFIRYINE